MCFTSTGDSSVALQQNGTPNTSANKVIQYKLNNGQWQTWDLSAISLADGDKMYIKSDDTIPISETYGIYKTFVMTGSIAASGNIMSLDPPMMMMSVALAGIEAELGEIKEISKNIYNFLQHDKEAEMKRK